MKQPVEDRYTGILEFGISDAEIFENLDYKNNSNYSLFEEEINELEKELVGAV